MTTLPPRLTSCHRHPDQQFTGFCAACLRERLSTLDQLQEPPRRSISSANPLKSIFRPGDTKNRPIPSSSSSTSFLPELRRCKSFSGPRAEAFASLFEPRRRSCDVRARSTLSSLFHQDDETNHSKSVVNETEADQRLETLPNLPESEIQAPERLPVEEIHEIAEAEEEIEVEEQITMKDYINIEAMKKAEPKTEKEKKDLKDNTGSFWLAASVFSKKWQNWRRKQKLKKSRSKVSVRGVNDKPALSCRSFRNVRFGETQSEVADYGLGRRSCDIDPRYSLDAGRISFDDARYSFDAPRASWDGYLTGGRVHRLPPMLSVVEDSPAPVHRPDAQILVEEARISISEDVMTPGGSIQTREYYSDSSSSSRRRKNLERVSSVRKVTEIDEKSNAASSRVSPPEEIKVSKASSVDRDSRDSNSNATSLRDECWESFDSVYRDASRTQTKAKKPRRWRMAWSIWGLIHRRAKDGEHEKYSRAEVVDRSFSESWPELRKMVNEDPRSSFSRRILRSNSSVSFRGSYNGGPVFDSARRNSVDFGGSRKKEDFLMERNRSARYSPSHFDTGLLRFYLGPLSSSRRGVVGISGKSRSKSSHSFARSFLRLY